MRCRFIGTAVMVFAVLLGGCGSPGAPAVGRQADGRQADGRQAAPKRVVASIMGDPHTVYQTLNPASRVRGIEHIQALVAGGLTREGEGILRAELAEAVPSVENGLWKVFPDGKMETTWKIRNGPEWHDGTPFTSADLVFVAQVVRDKDLPIFSKVMYEFIDTVEAPDSLTLTIKWKSTYIDADTMFGVSAVPFARHRLEKPYVENKETFIDDPYWSFEYVGTGPFTIKTWERGSHMIVRANDRYVLGRPKVDEVELRFIEDANATQANLLAGAVDMTLGRNLSGPQALEISNRWTDGRMYVNYDGANQIALYVQHINPNPPIVTDLTFKRAALHAIDRQAMVDALVTRQSEVAHSWLRPGQPAYREIEARNLVKYEYDPRRAIQMLETIGYTRGADRAMRDSSGRQLGYEVRTTGGDDLREKMLFTIADDWQQIGMAISPYVIPRQQADDLEYRATYPAMELVRQGLDHTGSRNIHSRNTPLAENSYRVTGNRSRYHSPELDSLIDRYLITIPLPERREAMGQIVRHISENLPFLMMLYTSGVYLVSNRIQNFKADGPWNAHEWDVTT